MAQFRSCPEDFEVEEELLYPPTGDGPYTLLRVEKKCRTTTEVAQALARALGRRPHQVGFAGRKDRDAVARQWFSLPDVDPQRALGVGLEGLRVLEAVRHWERLRLGELLENRFRLVIRELEPDDRSGLDARLRGLAERGFANRFGDQRFGRDGSNAAAALDILTGSRSRDGSRPDRRPGRGRNRHVRFLISALQSAVFNDLIEERQGLVEGDRDPSARPIDRLFAGDLAIEHATGRLVPIDDPERFAVQLDAFVLSPTGALFGQRVRPTGGAVGELEAAVLRKWKIPEPSDWRLPWTLAGDRRALRVRPRAARVIDTGGDSLVVELTLPAGVYATVALAELFPGIEEGALLSEWSE